MGLDITAYSNLLPVGKHVDGWCSDEDEHGDLVHIQAFAYDCFPNSFRGIPVLGTTKGVGSSSFMDGGCFVVTEQTEVLGFHAGSYGGYNMWREDLQRQFNRNRDPDAPFYELIWFSDNEGTIGPEAAADLLADFQKYGDSYKPDLVGADYAVEKYRGWTRAFELAADHGLVRFH